MSAVVKAGEVGQQQHLALLVGQVVQGVEHGLLLGAEPLLAVPQPGDVPPLGHRPRARAHPLLGVGQPAHLAPVVTGGHERVADRAAGGGQVTGERVGLEHQPSAAGEVELVEVGLAGWKRWVGGHDRPRLPACLTGLVPVLGQDGTAMTDLLSRPSAASTSERPGGRLSGLSPPPVGRRLRGPTAGEPEGRPLTVTAAIAAVGAAGTTMVTFMGARGHRLVPGRRRGPRADHRRAAGRRRRLAGRPRVAADRLRRTPRDRAADRDRAARGRRSTASAAGQPRPSQPVEDDRTVALAATIFTGIYVVVAVVTCVVAAQDSASPSLGRAILGSLLVAGIAGTLGLGVGTGRLRGWVERVPALDPGDRLRRRGAFLLLVAASARAGGRGPGGRAQRGGDGDVRAAPRARATT